MASNPKGSCKRLKQAGGAWNNGVYTISPAWMDFQVYCNMEISWGGWTMVARSVEGGWTYNGNANPFGWTINLWDVNDDAQAFSLGSSTNNIPFEKVLNAWYTTWKNIWNYGFIYHINDANLKNNTVTSVEADSCTTVIPFNNLDGSEILCWSLKHLWNYDCWNHYNFDLDGWNCSRWLQQWGHYQTHSVVEMTGYQWMVFIK
jgi:hypothetical protein